MTGGAPVSPFVQRAMERALLEAERAADAGEVPVGAVVILSDTGTLVTTAQNRMVRDGDATAHAELLALRTAAPIVGDRQLTRCTLVVTLEPCAMCAGAIVLSRIGALVFGAWDDKAGMCGSVGDLVRHPRLNHRPAVQGGILAEPSRQLLTAFFAKRRSP